MYWLIVLILILAGNQIIYRHNRKNHKPVKDNFLSFTVLFMLAYTIMLLCLSYFAPVFLSPTKDISTTKMLSPMSIAEQPNGQPKFVGQTHRHGEDSLIYFVVENDGSIHQRLIPQEQASVLEKSNVGMIQGKPNKNAKKPLKHPYVVTVFKQYKDTWVNRYIFVNANQPVTGRSSLVGVKLYIPENSNKIKYILDY